jgi:hypothetical protein
MKTCAICYQQIPEDDTHEYHEGQAVHIKCFVRAGEDKLLSGWEEQEDGTVLRCCAHGKFKHGACPKCFAKRV